MPLSKAKGKEGRRVSKVKSITLCIYYSFKDKNIAAIVLVVLYVHDKQININVMRQTACLVVNPIKVNSFAYLFNCTTVGRTSD